MSKFNKKVRPEVTENLAGGEAYKESPKLEFATLLLTSFVKNQFYRGEDETLKRLKALLDGDRVPLKFAAQASLYARNEFGMRSITHVTAGEVAHRGKNLNWTKNYFARVFHRPDDVLETFSYYITNYGRRPIPNSLKKGSCKYLSSLNDYSLAKYKGEGKAVKMVDVVNLVHAHSRSIDKLMKGTLNSAATWEVRLTEAGQKAETEEEKQELKKDAWADLLNSNKLGYFALLRNLRNIIEQAPNLVDLACGRLVDTNAITKSLVLPFRFVTAIEELEKVNGARKVLEAVSYACEVSLSNCPNFPGKTLICLDGSGSMTGKPLEIGALFAAVLYKKCDADFISFSSEAKQHTYNTRDSLTTVCEKMKKYADGGGTNFHAPFEIMHRSYDRIIFLSDMQGWVGYTSPQGDFEQYKRLYKCNPYLYSFDLQGYGTLQFPQNKVFCVAGFSEKIFDVMKLLEQDREALIHKIEAIEL